MIFKHTCPLQPILPDNVVDQAIKHASLGISEAPRRVGRQIRELMTQDKDLNFPVQISYEDESVTLTQDLYNRLTQQLVKNRQQFGISRSSQYLRQEFDADTQQEICQYLPQTLRDLNPTVILQSVTVPGQGLIPHSDWIRRASLFCPLDTGGDWDTVWYDGPDPKIHSMIFGFWWPWIDPELIQETTRVRFQPRTWHLFDNESYHSVQSRGQCWTRTALGIEFRSGHSAQQIYDILAQQQLLT